MPRKGGGGGVPAQLLDLSLGGGVTALFLFLPGS